MQLGLGCTCAAAMRCVVAHWRCIALGLGRECECFESSVKNLDYEWNLSDIASKLSDLVQGDMASQRVQVVSLRLKRSENMRSYRSYTPWISAV